MNRTKTFILAGVVPATLCPHYIKQSDANRGWTRCVRCELTKRRRLSR